MAELLDARIDTRKPIALADASARTGLPEAEIIRLLGQEQDKPLTACRVRQLCEIRNYRLRRRSRLTRGVFPAKKLIEEAL